STVKLYGEMQMSEDDVMAFYPELLNYLIPEFNLFNDNFNKEWIHSIILAAWFHTHPDYCYLLDVNNEDGGMNLRMVLDSSGAKSLDHSSAGPFDDWSDYLHEVAGFDMENGDEEELEDSDDENNDFDDLPIDNDDE
uniref:SET domain-containing protein n=1 Tax=Panagrellus redivivus TaxID=6233 RepID=A0A7E4VW87_PANRE